MLRTSTDKMETDGEDPVGLLVLVEICSCATLSSLCLSKCRKPVF